MSQREIEDLMDRLKVFNNTTGSLMEIGGVYNTQVKGRMYVVVEVREQEKQL